MKIEVLNGPGMNGTASVGPGMQGDYASNLGLFDDYQMQGTARVEPSMNGLEPRDPDMSDDDWDAYVFGYYYNDPEANMQGLRDWLKKRKKRRQERKAKRTDRRDKRRDIRMTRREEGTRFIDRVGKAVQDFGRGRLTEAEAMTVMQDEGVDINPGNFMDVVKDFGSDIVAKGAKKSMDQWWVDNKNWAIPVGLVVVAGGIYAATGGFSKKKRRRRR